MLPAEWVQKFEADSLRCFVSDGHAGITLNGFARLRWTPEVEVSFEAWRGDDPSTQRHRRIARLLGNMGIVPRIAEPLSASATVRACLHVSRLDALWAAVDRGRARPRPRQAFGVASGCECGARASVGTQAGSQRGCLVSTRRVTPWIFCHSGGMFDACLTHLHRRTPHSLDPGRGALGVRHAGGNSHGVRGLACGLCERQRKTWSARVMRRQHFEP